MTDNPAQSAAPSDAFEKPALKFELDVSYDDGKSYSRAGGANSVDGCKAVATRLRKTDSGYRINLLFRIYFGNGGALLYVGRDRGSWRLSWSPGNNRPRNDQADTRG